MSQFFPNNGENSQLIPKWESKKVSCDWGRRRCCTLTGETIPPRTRSFLGYHNAPVSLVSVDVKLYQGLWKSRELAISWIASIDLNSVDLFDLKPC